MILPTWLQILREIEKKAKTTGAVTPAAQTDQDVVSPEK